jgi:hypothetical protein
MGAYGLLLRQYLDVSGERLTPAEWRVVIDGIDIFQGYRNPVWSYAYNRITIGDIREILEIDRYDLILCNDVLEHLSREEAPALVARLLSHCKVLLATSPSGEYPQGACCGNEAERHQITVTPDVFSGLVHTVHVGVTNCYVCTLDESTARRLRELARTCPQIRRRQFPLRSVARRLWRRLVRGRGVVSPATAAEESGA